MIRILALINIYLYYFNEFCIIIQSFHSFQTSIYIASITYLSLGRHGCRENMNKDAKFYWYSSQDMISGRHCCIICVVYMLRSYAMGNLSKKMCVNIQLGAQPLLQ
jgi:hypothetical protein